MRLQDAVRQRFEVAQKIGDEFLVRCPDPDHEDRNPSAAINTRKGLWVCYSCGAGGRVIDLLDGVRVEDESTEDLIEELQADVAILDDTPTYLPERWLDQFTGAAHPYWLRRGMSEETVAEFGLGYDPAFQPRWDEPPIEAVTMPLRAPTGGLLGVVHRRLDDAKPKYHYPHQVDVSRCLFAFERVREGCEHVTITEGAIDAILLWQEGIPALAAYSDRLSQAQEALIRRLDPVTVTLAFDQDEPGEKAVQRILHGEKRKGRHRPPADFGSAFVRVAFWDPVEGKDIADLAPHRRYEVIESADLHT